MADGNMEMTVGGSPETLRHLTTEGEVKEPKDIQPESPAAALDGDLLQVLKSSEHAGTVFMRIEKEIAETNKDVHALSTIIAELKMKETQSRTDFNDLVEDISVRISALRENVKACASKQASIEIERKRMEATLYADLSQQINQLTALKSRQQIIQDTLAGSDWQLRVEGARHRIKRGKDFAGALVSVGERISELEEQLSLRQSLKDVLGRAESGTAALILEVMRRNVKSSSLQHEGCAALLHLFNKEEASEHLVGKLDVIDLITECMNQHIANLELQTAASRLLAKLLARAQMLGVKKHLLTAHHKVRKAVFDAMCYHSANTSHRLYYNCVQCLSCLKGEKGMMSSSTISLEQRSLRPIRTFRSAKETDGSFKVNSSNEECHQKEIYQSVAHSPDKSADNLTASRNEAELVQEQMERSAEMAAGVIGMAAVRSPNKLAHHPAAIEAEVQCLLSEVASGSHENTDIVPAAFALVSLLSSGHCIGPVFQSDDNAEAKLVHRLTTSEDHFTVLLLSSILFFYIQENPETRDIKLQRIRQTEDCLASMERTSHLVRPESGKLAYSPRWHAEKSEIFGRFESLLHMLNNK